MTAVEQIWVEIRATGLPAESEAFILKWAADYPDIEVCGFITSGGTVIPMENLYENPACGFEMDRSELVRVTASHEIAGVYHSHPSGSPHPGTFDTEHMNYLYQQGCPWDYYIIAGGKVRRYEHRDRQ